MANKACTCHCNYSCISVWHWQKRKFTHENKHTFKSKLLQPARLHYLHFVQRLEFWNRHTHKLDQLVTSLLFREKRRKQRSQHQHIYLSAHRYKQHSPFIYMQFSHNHHHTNRYLCVCLFCSALLLTDRICFGCFYFQFVPRLNSNNQDSFPTVITFMIK